MVPSVYLSMPHWLNSVAFFVFKEHPTQLISTNFSVLNLPPKGMIFVCKGLWNALYNALYNAL